METDRGVLGQGAIYEHGIKIANFTDYPERICCVPSFLPGHDDAYGRFLAAARDRFAGEPDINGYARRHTTEDDVMAISEYARQLMTEALDEGTADNR
jgi:hypothetical protein